MKKINSVSSSVAIKMLSVCVRVYGCVSVWMLTRVAQIATAAQETCNLARTYLLMNSDHTPKSSSGWPTLLGKIPTKKAGVNRHFRASWASQTWAACYNQTSIKTFNCLHIHILLFWHYYI